MTAPAPVPTGPPPADGSSRGRQARTGRVTRDRRLGRGDLPPARHTATGLAFALQLNAAASVSSVPAHVIVEGRSAARRAVAEDGRDRAAEAAPDELEASLASAKASTKLARKWLESPRDHSKSAEAIRLDDIASSRARPPEPTRFASKSAPADQKVSLDESGASSKPPSAAPPRMPGHDPSGGIDRPSGLKAIRMAKAGGNASSLSGPLTGGAVSPNPSTRLEPWTSDSPSPVAQVANVVERQAQLGPASVVVVRLDPPALGRVLLRISTTDGQRVRIHLTVEDGLVRDSLTAGWGQVESALRAHGLSPEGMTIDVGAFSHPDAGAAGFADHANGQSRDSPRGDGGRQTVGPIGGVQGVQMGDLVQSDPLLPMSRLVDYRI